MRSIFAVLTLLLTACDGGCADGSGGGKNCTTGKPCGNSCISVNDTCRVGEIAPRAGSRAEEGIEPYDAK